MIEKRITEIIKPVIEEMGFILDEVTYDNENLTVVVDKNGIMTIEEIVEITKKINPILDEKDIIKNSYVLDVCSKEKGSI